MRLHRACALAVSKTQRLRHRGLLDSCDSQRRTDQASGGGAEEGQGAVRCKAEAAGDIDADRECRQRFLRIASAAPLDGRTECCRHDRHRMDDGGFMHGIPFEAMDAKAVDEGSGGSGEAFIGAEEAGVATAAEIARGGQDGVGTGGSCAGRTHGKRVGEKADGIGADLGRQDVWRAGKGEEVAGGGHYKLTLSVSLSLSKGCPSSAPSFKKKDRPSTSSGMRGWLDITTTNPQASPQSRQRHRHAARGPPHDQPPPRAGHPIRRAYAL